MKRADHSSRSHGVLAAFLALAGIAGACGEAGTSSGPSTVDVGGIPDGGGATGPGSDVGLDDGGSQLPPPQVVVLLAGDHRSGLRNALLAWGLPESDATTVADQIDEALDSGDCSRLTPLLSSDSTRTVAFACLPAASLGTMEVYSVHGEGVNAAGESPTIGRLHAAVVRSSYGANLALYQPGEQADRVADALAAWGMPNSRVDAVAETVEDMVAPHRCDRTVLQRAEVQGQEVTEIACSEGPALGGFSVKLITIRYGAQLRGLEMLNLGAAGLDGVLTVAAHRYATVHVHQLQSAEELPDILSRHLVLSSREAAVGMVARLAEFLAGVQPCPETQEWLLGLGQRPALVRFAPGVEAGPLVSCDLRVVFPGSGPTDPDRIVTVSALRALGGGRIEWIDPESLEIEVRAALERAYVTREAAVALTDALVFSLQSATCEARPEVDDSDPDLELAHELTCDVVYGGLPEVGTQTFHSVRELGFEPARLLGAQPLAIATLTSDLPSYLSADQVGPEIAVALHWPPRTATETLDRGTHHATMTARLVAWGLSSAAASEALARLNTQLANSSAEVYPLLLEEDARAIFFNRGWRDEQLAPHLHVVHALKRGGPELELIVLPALVDEADDSFELRNSVADTVEAGLRGVLMDFNAPLSLEAETAEVLIDMIQNQGCPRSDVITHPDIAGAVRLDCAPLEFDYPRPSLDAVVVIDVDFEHDEPLDDEEGFPIMRVTAFRSSLRGDRDATLNDELVVLDAMFSSPNLPRRLDPILVVDADSSLDLIVESLLDRSFSQSESRLVKTTLEQLVDSGLCPAVEPVVVVEGDRLTTFGCLLAADAVDVDLYLASVVGVDGVDGPEVTEFTVYVAASPEESDFRIVTELDALEDTMEVFSEDIPGLSEEEAALIFDLVTTTPESCRDPVTVDLGTYGTLTFECTAWGELQDGSRAFGDVGASKAIVTWWHVSHGESSGYLYFIDDPGRSGEEAVLDGFLLSTLETIAL